MKLYHLDIPPQVAEVLRHVPPDLKRSIKSTLQLLSTNPGNVEKSRQRRSRPFAVLTYEGYAPRVNRAAALLDGLF